MSGIETITFQIPGHDPVTVTPTQLKRGLRMLKGRERMAAQGDVEDVAGPGHNGPETAQWGNIAADRLRSIVERIERLEEERKSLSGDIRDIFLEAKSAGFSVKVLRALIRLRKQEPADAEEEQNLLDVYARALGMP